MVYDEGWVMEGLVLAWEREIQFTRKLSFKKEVIFAYVNEE